jgi:hypothetical protein
MEEVHISPITKKVPSERYYVIQEDDHPSNYNIEEIFGAFTFNLHRKEVSWKRVMKVNQSEGTLEEMQEDEVLFDKTDEDHVTVARASTTLTQAIAHNITIFNEKPLEAKSKNCKLKNDLIILREEIKKRRKVDDNLVLLKENFLEQQEKLHHVKLE